MAKLKWHRHIMVNEAVSAMRFATRPELPQELSFGVGVGEPYRRSGKKFGVGNITFLRVSGWQI